MRKLSVILLFIVTFFSCGDELAYRIEEFNGAWEFQQQGDSIWYTAEVPGVVHTDLLRNELIEDPYYGINEQELQWIENENWVYRTKLNISDEQFDYDNVSIDFEGIDTYAKVYLNGILILEANNMFRSWNMEIKEWLQEGENDLKVVFESPLKHNKELVENYPYNLPSGNETVDLKVGNFSRKAAYHFGWDWGPRFVTSGIWRPIKLHFWDAIKINDVYITTDEIQDDKALLKGTVSLELESSKEVFIKTKIIQEKKRVKEDIQKFSLEEGLHEIPMIFTIRQPKLWWPKGSGNQSLYKLEVEIVHEDQILASDEISFGIRTVELMQEEDYVGTSYYFKVNGKPVYMKGANYIPQDMFLPRVTDQKYEQLFEKITSANMNMIRVWGGGIYENDIFYELCDKNGILVWQDFMFAGSMYPNIEGFKENISEEVSENIKRLRNHPSIALWCGNNEIEVAWENWGWQKSFGYSSQDSTEIFNTYKSIFKELIPTKVEKLSNIPYISTSPTSNWGTHENFNHGSMHYWGVWHGREPFENYQTNVGRFMVEYGFQSFPETSTIEKFTTPKDYSLDSEVMLNRQKSYIGNGLISTHINRWFGEPKSFEEFVQKSQSTQQIAMQMAVQAHRLKAPVNMGTLFWQLNDCWPGPSWSVIDYYGNDKEAYKTISENFKDIIAVYDRDKSEITVINDSSEALEGTVQIQDGDRVYRQNVYVLPKSRHRVDFKSTFKGSFIIVSVERNGQAIFNDKVYLKKN